MQFLSKEGHNVIVLLAQVRFQFSIQEMDQRLCICLILLLSLVNYVLCSSEEEEDEEDKNKKDPIKTYERKILGRYELDSDMRKNDFQELLKAMEFSDAKRNLIKVTKPVYVAFQREGKDLYKFVVEVGINTVKQITFESGVEVVETFPGFPDKRYKLNITLVGNNSLEVREDHLGFECHHTTKHDAKGMNVNYNCKNVTAKQRWKRAKKPKSMFDMFFGK